MDHIEAHRWRRLRPLLDRAVELDCRSRQAFLDGLHGDDLELKDALENLLARHLDPRENVLSIPAVRVVLDFFEGERGYSSIYERRASMASACRASGVREIDEIDPADKYLSRPRDTKDVPK